MAKIKGWTKVGVNHWMATKAKSDREIRVEKHNGEWYAVLRRVSNNNVLGRAYARTKAEAIKHSTDTMRANPNG